MTFLMIALTNSLHKLVNATIKYTGEPTRSLVEFAFNLGVDNWDQTYGTTYLAKNMLFENTTEIVFSRWTLYGVGGKAELLEKM